MSVSKLESLPNEILIELFERYINGIDIIKALRFQLNERFDSLIQQCQRFNFNFIKCHKDDFCFSIGLLQAYIDRIEQLALSEQNAPGQIHAFLAFSSSFTRLTRLRKLYININDDAVQLLTLTRALESLSTTCLHTLSIVINKTNTLTSFDTFIAPLFCMETLKNLSIISNNRSDRINWQQLSSYCSNVEHFTLKGFICDFDDLLCIFRCASGLKYIDLTLQTNRYNATNKEKESSEKPIIQMSKLHTMIMKINGDTTSIHNSINSIFQYIPSLYRLEVTIDRSSFDVTVWENLAKNYLPKLVYFTLEYTSYILNDDDVNNVLATMQLPFWTQRKHFNIVLKQCRNVTDHQYYLDSLENSHMEESDTFVGKWYILPQRQQENIRLHPTNLIISNKSNLLIQNSYLNNVQNLIIIEMNDNLFELLTTHVSFFQIKHLDISSIQKTNNSPLPILISMINLKSLRITNDQLNLLQSTPLRNHHQLKFIDLSIARHHFRQAHIQMLWQVFPYLEHLCIASNGVTDVPSLNSYFPKLRSFTFTTDNTREIDIDDDYEMKMYDVNLRRNTSFLFYHKAQWLTIWLDQAVYRENVWKYSDLI